jgi:hypothetical protein
VAYLLFAHNKKEPEAGDTSGSFVGCYFAADERTAYTKKIEVAIVRQRNKTCHPLCPDGILKHNPPSVKAQKSIDNVLIDATIQPADENVMCQNNKSTTN